MKFVYVLIPLFCLAACADISDNSSSITSVTVWDTASAILVDSVVEEDANYIPNVSVDSYKDSLDKFPSYILMPYQYHGDEITEVIIK